MQILKLALLVLLCGLSVGAQKTKPLSDSELSAITERGKFLDAYDRAAWHATDAVVALHPTTGAVRRYIARKTAAGWVVVFGRLNETHDAFEIVYEATQGSKPAEFTVKTFDPPQHDTGFYLAAAKAIELALQNATLEKRPYNTYVLPLDSGELYVYILPAQTKENPFPLGGDVRFRVSADGANITETRQLHKTILPVSKVPPGAKTVSGVHSHVLTDTPEDTDVFHVLTQNPPMPELVATRSGNYSIQTDGTIHVAK
jgi:hypothetical protein